MMLPPDFCHPFSRRIYRRPSRRVFPRIASVALALFSIVPLAAQTILDPLDHVSDALYYETDDGFFAIRADGTAEITGYYFNQEPVGIIFVNPGEHWQYNPRLTINADAFVGERLSGHLKFRWDDGIDPGYEDNQARLDEIFADIAVAPGYFDLRVGRFAAIFGNWIPRLDAWDNPFISPPLPYDQVTSVTDNAAPPNATAFANRRNALVNNKTWVPVVWGPVYTQGAAGLASWRDFTLSVSGTNRSLSSRPPEWDDYDWSDPTFTGRLGYTPVADWSFGLSGSFGAYLRDSADASLPAGTEIGDFDQIVVGIDVAWASGPWQVWAEAIYSEFDVPNVSDPARVYSYYIETKYKITPKLFGALRFGQQFYNEIDTPAGPVNWDNDQLRAEAAIGYKFGRHALIKFQYSYQHQFTSFQDGENQIAGQFVIKF